MDIQPAAGGLPILCTGISRQPCTQEGHKKGCTGDTRGENNMFVFRKEHAFALKKAAAGGRSDYGRGSPAPWP